LKVKLEGPRNGRCWIWSYSSLPTEKGAIQHLA